MFIKAYLHNVCFSQWSFTSGARYRHGESVFITKCLSWWPQPSFPGPSLPNTLINEFWQLSGNLPSTIHIPSLLTLIFHTFILFFFNCGKGWTLSAISLGKQLSLVDAISHVCGRDHFAARYKKKSSLCWRSHINSLLSRQLCFFMAEIEMFVRPLYISLTLYSRNRSTFKNDNYFQWEIRAAPVSCYV